MLFSHSEITLILDCFSTIRTMQDLLPKELSPLALEKLEQKLSNLSVFSNISRQDLFAIGTALSFVISLYEEEEDYAPEDLYLLATKIAERLSANY